MRIPLPSVLSSNYVKIHKMLDWESLTWLARQVRAQLWLSPMKGVPAPPDIYITIRLSSWLLQISRGFHGRSPSHRNKELAQHRSVPLTCDLQRTQSIDGIALGRQRSSEIGTFHVHPECWCVMFLPAGGSDQIIDLTSITATLARAGQSQLRGEY